MERAKEALVEIRRNLEEGIIPFWVEKGVDKEYGGYLTCFDCMATLAQIQTNISLRRPE